MYSLGEPTCPRKDVCNLNGFVQGGLLNVTFNSNRNSCLQSCKQTDGCKWYTFDQSDDYCFLLETFDYLDETCTTCNSGQVNCNGNSTISFHVKCCTIIFNQF